MPADQAFMDRLHRIEAGKAWVPEGVIVDRGKKRKRVDINAGQKRVTLLLSIGLIWGLVWVFAQAQPELYGVVIVFVQAGFMIQRKTFSRLNHIRLNRYFIFKMFALCER